MAIDYLRICCIVSFGIVFFSIFKKLLQSTGHSVFSTISQIGGAVANIILDPIMIYGYLGFPALGVNGAAYATVTGQIVSLALALIFHHKINKEISNHPKYFKPFIRIIKEIYAIGLPAIIAQALMSVMTYGLNIILGMIGESMVTAYGLYYKVQQFVLFAAFGLRDSITPIVSFNHDLCNQNRIKEEIKYGMIYTLSIMAAGLIILEIFAAPISKIFGLSGDTQTLCVSAMHIVSVCFFAGANIAFQGIFQALDGGIESLIISLCRQLVFILTVAWILAEIAVNNANYTWLVWVTFPIAEIVTAAIACLLMIRTYKNKIENMHEDILEPAADIS